MAVKKSKPAEAIPSKAPKVKQAAKAKVGGAAAPAPATKVKARKAAPAVATATASKAETPKATTAPKPPTAASAPKKAAAPVKLTDRQLDFLKQIQGAKESGYLLEKKAEKKTIDALLTRKLIKKGAKDKASGHFRYMVSKAGEKHLSTASPA